MRYQLCSATRTYTNEVYYFIINTGRQRRSVKFGKVESLFESNGKLELSSQIDNYVAGYQIIAESDILEELQLQVPWLFL